MEDHAIVALYWQREEAAIEATQAKYGAYLTKIAHNILADDQDSQECVNDTYWNAWRSIPPHRPQVLSTYLAKLTRRGAIDQLRRRNRAKRRGSEYTLSLSELSRDLSTGDTTSQAAEAQALARAIGDYLRTLSPEARTVFLCRYYFLDPIREVAAHHGMTQAKVKSLLHRTRQGLKAHLEQEGFDL